MDLKEHIELIEEQRSDSARFRAEALAGNKMAMAANNMSSYFMETLELGLMQWRAGIDPTSNLTQAVKGILLDRDILLDREAGVLKKLPLFYSVYVASLLNIPHPGVDLALYEETIIPGAFLGNVLMGQDSIENWPNYQNKLPKDKRCTLARATHELYAGMLSGKISPAEGIKKGETFYSRRKDDAFYNDSAVLHGGNWHNNRFVDFRLAAVLKHIGSTVPSIHAWRW